LLLAVFLVWLLFGSAWGTIHWLIVPRIGEFRPQLQAYASQVLGVTVRIEAVSAHSDGLVPSFELTGVTLLDDQGREALSLPRVLVAVSPRSAWRLGFEQLYIDQPKLDIRRATDGRVTVAGLNFAGTQGSNPKALNWFFSQIEFVVHDGVIRWTDEQRHAEPIVLQQVNLVMRNRGRHHDFRFDATPPSEWGDRFNFRGRFLQPLLALQNGKWQDWQGQLFAAFEHVDLSELRRYVDLGFDLHRGRGALRAWVEVNRGEFTAATADVALTEVALTLSQDLQPLSLRQVQGRIGARGLSGGVEVATQALGFETQDGLHWPASTIKVVSMAAQGKAPARGEIQADHLELAALAQIADRLPLDATMRSSLISYAPKGLIESLNATWQGSIHAPVQYTAKGRLRQFELVPVQSTPGVRGLDVDFDLNQQTGHARVAITNGSLDVPGIFQESVIPIDQLSAQLTWKRVAEQVSVELVDVTFRNADAQGQAHIKWQTSDPALAASHSRFPGVLDLQATLSRAEGRRVYRYLPLVIDKAARDYVREAVKGGNASNVRFSVKGDIDQIPARIASQGEFKIMADVSQAQLDYVPASLQNAGELPWPAVYDLSGNLVIDRLQLHVIGARGRLGDGTALQLTRVDASIADLLNTQVQVNAEMKGPLKEALRVVNNSPLADITGQALSRSIAAGQADYKLKLLLPVADLSKTTVQGSVTLVGNDVLVSPDIPQLGNARGTVNYTHTGFNFAGIQTRLLGGDARLEGGWVLVPNANSKERLAPSVIRITGSASAEGLRQATELGFVSRLARQANGSANYNATLGWRSGSPELLMTSDLQGLALSLPAPLHKEPASRLPLRFQTTLTSRDGSTPGPQSSALTDRLSLSLEGVAQVIFERDLSLTEPRVLRGSVAVGADTLNSLSLPAQGVAANISLPQFNVDAWADVLEGSAAGSVVHMAYLPTVLAVRTDNLTFGGRTFNQVVIGAHREGLLWRGNVTATELNGYLEYQQAAQATASGRVYARLARLTIAQNTAAEVEALLDAQPASIPALDIVVDDFELRGKSLGRLEVEAINRAGSASASAAEVREWRLNKFNLSVPEAKFTASGNWARINAQSTPTKSGSAAVLPERRRTVMNFKLDIADGGHLLTRFGMKDVVRQASGKMEGQVAWIGSPLKLDYPSLGGAFTVNIASGQFLKADPGLAKLLGVLSLQALPRRLTLDFRDVFSEGFSFDFLRGDVTVDKGIARTNNLQMKGINAAVLMEGMADIANETQDLKVVVVPEINAGTASLIATVINPAIGLGTFLAQWVLRRPLMDSATQEFHIDGSWADPQVTKVNHSNTPAKETTK